MKLKDIAALKDAQQYIEAHLLENIPVAALCQRYHINREKLQGLFKQLLGNTVHDYIRKQKLRYGAERILHSDDSIEKIAEHLGYCKSNFFKRFKAEYNCTPDEYRILHRIPPTMDIPKVNFTAPRSR